jgi:serine/threonine-protein kinase
VTQSRPGGTDPLIGQLIANRYRVDKLIGRGGMCAVYRGENMVRAREIAIKVLPPDKAADEELARRFQREVVTAKRLHHPNVATISDSGSLEDGSLFLIMELLDGHTLAHEIEQGRLELSRALAIARQLLLGLSDAHRHGIVHRDVKPGNVMLVDRDGVETVKLFDFGIASNAKAAIRLTTAGAAFGTPAYISPEMAMGQRVDGRADLYAVGVTLFEMVTGRLPFLVEDGVKLLRAHIHEEAPSPRQVAPDAGIPVQIDHIIVRSLRKEPDERFPTADAMIRAIDIATGRRPASAAQAIYWAAAVIAVGVGIVAAWWWWFR